MSLNTPLLTAKNKASQQALMPPAPKRPTLSLDTDRLAEPKLLKTNPNAPLPPSLVAAESAKLKESKSLSDPNFPLGADISQMNLSSQEIEVFVNLGSDIGKMLDTFKNSRSKQVAEIESALLNIQNATSLDSAKGSVDFLRKVKIKLENFRESIKILRIFNSQNSGFSSLNNAAQNLVQEYKSADNYNQLTDKIHEISRIAKFCIEYSKVADLLEKNSDDISPELQVQITELKNIIKNGSYDTMNQGLGGLREVVDFFEKTGSQENLQKIKNYQKEKNSVLSTLSFAVSDPNISDIQRIQFTGLLYEMQNYEVDRKEITIGRLTSLLKESTVETSVSLEKQLNDLQNLSYPEYVANYEYEDTLKYLDDTNEAVEKIILSFEPPKPIQDDSTFETMTVPTSFGERIYQDARITDEASEILAPTEDLDVEQKDLVDPVKETIKIPEVVSAPLTVKLPIVPNNTIKKKTNILQNTRNFLQKNTKGVLSVLTATALSATAYFGSKEITPPNTLTSADITRLNKAFEVAKLDKGQLAQAVRKFPNGVTPENLAMERANLTRPTQSESITRESARRFVDDINKSNQKTQAEKVVQAAITENESNPETIAKLNDALKNLQQGN